MCMTMKKIYIYNYRVDDDRSAKSDKIIFEYVSLLKCGAFFSRDPLDYGL